MGFLMRLDVLIVLREHLAHRVEDPLLAYAAVIRKRCRHLRNVILEYTDTLLLVCDAPLLVDICSKFSPCFLQGELHLLDDLRIMRDRLLRLTRKWRPDGYQRHD